MGVVLRVDSHIAHSPENAGINYLESGEVRPGERGVGLQVTASISTNFLILIGIFFPSVTGKVGMWGREVGTGRWGREVGQGHENGVVPLDSISPDPPGLQIHATHPLLPSYLNTIGNGEHLGVSPCGYIQVLQDPAKSECPD